MLARRALLLKKNWKEDITLIRAFVKQLQPLEVVSELSWKQLLTLVFVMLGGFTMLYLVASHLRGYWRDPIYYVSVVCFLVQAVMSVYLYRKSIWKDDRRHFRSVATGITTAFGIGIGLLQLLK